MKEEICIGAADYKGLADGTIDMVEIMLDGIPAYIEAVDYNTGLKVGDRNVSVNYYAPDPDDYEITVRGAGKPA